MPECARCLWDVLMGKTRPCPCPRGAHTPAVTKVVSLVLGKSYQLDLYSKPGTCPLLPLPPSPCVLPLDPQASSSPVPCSSPSSRVCASCTASGPVSPLPDLSVAPSHSGKSQCPPRGSQVPTRSAPTACLPSSFITCSLAAQAPAT